MIKKLEKLRPLFITLFVLFSMVSISLSQIMLAHAFAVAGLLVLTKQVKIRFPAFFWGVVAYSALSIMSSFSLSIRESV